METFMDFNSSEKEPFDIELCGNLTQNYYEVKYQISGIMMLYGKVGNISEAFNSLQKVYMVKF